MARPLIISARVPAEANKVKTHNTIEHKKRNQHLSGFCITLGDFILNKIGNNLYKTRQITKSMLLEVA